MLVDIRLCSPAGASSDCPRQRCTATASQSVGATLTHTETPNTSHQPLYPPQPQSGMIFLSSDGQWQGSCGAWPWRHSGRGPGRPSWQGPGRVLWCQRGWRSLVSDVTEQMRLCPVPPPAGERSWVGDVSSPGGQQLTSLWLRLLSSRSS